MLNEHDRRELSLIEQELCSDDPRLADTFRTGRPASSRGRRWSSRALVGFGTVTLVVGLVARADGLFLQGLLVLGGGIGWVVHLRVAAGKSRSGQSDDHPEGMPPERFRST
jgi:hypothetical protein